MMRRPFRRTASIALALFVWGTALAIALRAADPSQPPTASPAAPQAFVGAARCADCHRSKHQQWQGARHGRMLQPASPATVLGDFAAAPGGSGQNVALRGATFTLVREADRFFVRGPFPTAETQVHRIEFTLGSRRVQHYLTRLPDGRIVVLPPTWDVQRREWFHNLDIVNPDDGAANPVQVWNTSCLGCHVSGAEKGYDESRHTYDTQWTDFGTTCERCHGPGAAHASRAAAPVETRTTDGAIVMPTRLAPERATAVCAQCHSLRDITAPGFTAGSDYFDHFTPVLEYAQKSGSDPAYWTDGRPRRFSNDAIGLWQSRCFLEGGATCTTCHLDPHEPDIDRNPQLARSNDGVCTKCHADIANAGPRHTRHAAGSPGGACIACHMPRTVISLRSRMPDHTVGVPAPENTVRHGIPNACTECHQERDAAWAARQLAGWYPNGRRVRLVARADAFSAARRRDPAALDAIIRIATDERQPPLVRANAIGYLRAYPGPRAETYLAAFASSEHAAVRLTAILGLSDAGFSPERVVPVLIHALGDTRRVVRVAAALSLVNLKVTTLEGAAGASFDQAKRDYLTRATLLADDGAALLDVGKFHLLNKNLDASVKSLEASLRLDPDLHASRYFLGLAFLAQGRIADARLQLGRIPQSDAHAAAAAKILAALPPRSAGCP